MALLSTIPTVLGVSLPLFPGQSLVRVNNNCKTVTGTAGPQTFIETALGKPKKRIPTRHLISYHQRQKRCLSVSVPPAIDKESDFEPGAHPLREIRLRSPVGGHDAHVGIGIKVGAFSEFEGVVAKVVDGGTGAAEGGDGPVADDLAGEVTGGGRLVDVEGGEG